MKIWYLICSIVPCDRNISNGFPVTYYSFYYLSDLIAWCVRAFCIFSCERFVTSTSGYIALTWFIFCVFFFNLCKSLRFINFVNNTRKEIGRNARRYWCVCFSKFLSRSRNVCCSVLRHLFWWFLTSTATFSSSNVPSYRNSTNFSVFRHFVTSRAPQTKIPISVCCDSLDEYSSEVYSQSISEFVKFCPDKNWTVSQWFCYFFSLWKVSMF